MRKELPLHIKKRSAVVVQPLIRMPPSRFPVDVYWTRGPGADPEYAGGITCPIWSRNALGSPRKSWAIYLGTKMFGLAW